MAMQMCFYGGGVVLCGVQEGCFAGVKSSALQGIILLLSNHCFSGRHGSLPLHVLPRLFKSPSFFGQTRGLFFGQTRGLFFGQTRESAPTRASKAIQTPLPSGGVGGWVIPLGRGWGWVIPLGRGRGWVLSLGQEGVGFHIALAEVLAPCGQLMVHQRGQLLLQLEEQPFARLVAVGVHVVFS